MVDMHIHTKYSDGQYTVEEIVKMLLELNIDVFSITDHDNVESCKEIEKIKLQHMKYIRGVEFSSKIGIYNCHILGYNFDYNNINIIKECQAIQKRRYEKIKKIINHIRTYNIDINEQEENEILNKQGTIGRMDICKLLIKKGYGNKCDIYDKYLTDVPNIQTHRSKLEDIINVIKNAHGISVLAHPKQIEDDYKVNIEDIIEIFINQGIDGIEIYNSIHTLKDVKRYLLLAKKYNLKTTGGSDFHGKIYPENHLGYTTTEQIQIKQKQINFNI